MSHAYSSVLPLFALLFLGLQTYQSCTSTTKEQIKQARTHCKLWGLSEACILLAGCLPSEQSMPQVATHLAISLCMHETIMLLLHCAASTLQVPAAIGERAFPVITFLRCDSAAILTSSAGFMAPEAEREKGAVTAATQDRDLE